MTKRNPFPEGPVDVQTSHDTLAMVLAELLDQMFRGSHMPKVYQYLKAVDALRLAAPNLHGEAYGINERYAKEVAQLVEDKVTSAADMIVREHLAQRDKP